METLQRNHKTIIVTGGDGFIGTHLVNRLKELGYAPTVVDEKRGQTYQNFFENHAWSIKDDAVVIHLAAYTEVNESIQQPGKFWSNNMIGVEKMIFGMPDTVKVIAASTCAVYGDSGSHIQPMSPYASSKYAMERFIQENQKNSVILRFYNVYGSGMKNSKYKSVMKAFIDAKKAGKPLTIYNDGKQKRDFIHVSDIVEGIIKAMSTKAGTYELSTGIGTSVNDIANLFGGKKEYKKLPFPEPRLIIGDKRKWLPKWKPTMKLEKGVKELLNDIK